MGFPCSHPENAGEFAGKNACYANKTHEQGTTRRRPGEAIDWLRWSGDAAKLSQEWFRGVLRGHSQAFAR